MPDPQGISKRAVLAVEGADELYLLLCLLKHVDLTALIHLHDLKGQKSLPDRLSALALTMAESTDVVALGVMLDAEPREDGDDEGRSPSPTPVQSALDRILTALKAALGLAAALAGHRAFTTFAAEKLDGRVLRVGAFVAPDGESPGMLEDLCLKPENVRSDAAMPCVEQYLQCLEAVGVHRPHWAKRRLHAFLASREKPGLKLGEAAQAGCWFFDDPVWTPLKDILRDLAQV